MRKKILFPTDFSDNAWSAAVYALNLYAHEKCTFYFLNATKVTVSRMSNMTNKLSKIMEVNALKELTELKEMAEASNTNVKHEFNSILSPDDLNTAIEKAVKKFSIDLVVMGTKGATKAKGLFFGSNTVNTIEKIKLAPVLVVPDEYDYVEPKQIAFPTDYNRTYGEVLLPLKHMASLFNSKLRIVHINEKDKLTAAQSNNLEMLKLYLKDYSCSFHWMPEYAKKTQEINNFIDELDINLLVMVNYKHSFIEDIIKEPVIKKIGFQPLIPLLVIPE